MKRKIIKVKFSEQRIMVANSVCYFLTKILAVATLNFKAEFSKIITINLVSVNLMAVTSCVTLHNEKY